MLLSGTARTALKAPCQTCANVPNKSSFAHNVQSPNATTTFYNYMSLRNQMPEEQMNLPSPPTHSRHHPHPCAATRCAPRRGNRRHKASAIAAQELLPVRLPVPVPRVTVNRQTNPQTRTQTHSLTHSLTGPPLRLPPHRRIRSSGSSRAPLWIVQSVRLMVS